jgi:hypothetical protein
MSRPEVRRRSRKGDSFGVSTRPNAPRIITVVVSLLLMVVGLSASGLFAIAPVNDLLSSADLSLTKQQGFLALLASPLLLVAGSYLRGV